jgi:hypothetical protein
MLDSKRLHACTGAALDGDIMVDNPMNYFGVRCPFFPGCPGGCYCTLLNSCKDTHGIISSWDAVVCLTGVVFVFTTHCLWDHWATDERDAATVFRKRKFVHRNRLRFAAVDNHAWAATPESHCGTVEPPSFEIVSRDAPREVRLLGLRSGSSYSPYRERSGVFSSRFRICVIPEALVGHLVGHPAFRSLKAGCCDERRRRSSHRQFHARRKRPDLHGTNSPNPWPLYTQCVSWGDTENLCWIL